MGHPLGMSTRGGVIVETLLLILLIMMIAVPSAWYIGTGLNYQFGGDEEYAEDDESSDGWDGKRGGRDRWHGGLGGVLLPRTGSRGR